VRFCFKARTSSLTMAPKRCSCSRCDLISARKNAQVAFSSSMASSCSPSSTLSLSSSTRSSYSLAYWSYLRPDGERSNFDCIACCCRPAIQSSGIPAGEMIKCCRLLGCRIPFFPKKTGSDRALCPLLLRLRAHCSRFSRSRMASCAWSISLRCFRSLARYVARTVCTRSFS